MKNYLIPIILFATAFGFSQQQREDWKEYQFASDAFAITLPYEPKPHKDSNASDINVYTVLLESDVKLSLRAASRKMDCAASFTMLKSGNAYKGNSSIVPGSIKDISLSGFPGIEYESKSGQQVFLERYYCVGPKFYTFSISLPPNGERLAVVDRVLNSFHLLK